MMLDPMAGLQLGNMPTFTIELNPPHFQSMLQSHGTRISLTGVYVATFNGKRSTER